MESKAIPAYQPKPLVLEVARMFLICIPVFLVVYSLAISACTAKEVYERVKG
jgi:hypothetical protein